MTKQEEETPQEGAEPQYTAQSVAKRSEEDLRSEAAYDENSIEVLEGLEAVRLRPGMYIGETDATGLHHLVWEVVDNGVDEALAGFATKLTVLIHLDGSVTIEDDGRGIPVAWKEKQDKSAAEVVMTELHAGAKFGNDAYKRSAGLHGVGVSCVNALSEWLDLEIRRDKRVHFMRFERGARVSESGTPEAPMSVRGTTERTGTKIHFKPDEEIFSTVEFQYERLQKRLSQLAFLNRGLTIDLKDERDDRHDVFFYEGGIKSYVEHINRNREVLHKPPIYFEASMDVTGPEGTPIPVDVEVALQWTASYSEHVFCFANNVYNDEGGTH